MTKLTRPKADLVQHALYQAAYDAARGLLRNLYLLEESLSSELQCADAARDLHDYAAVTGSEPVRLLRWAANLEPIYAPHMDRALALLAEAAPTPKRTRHTAAPVPAAA